MLVVLQRLDADAMEGLVGERLVTEDCPTVASVVVLLSTWLTFATCEERELIMSLLQMMTSLKVDELRHQRLIKRMKRRFEKGFWENFIF